MFMSIKLNLHHLNHRKNKNTENSQFWHLSHHFSKLRLFLKFRFFDHSYESVVFTPAKSSATDSPHWDHDFGGTCDFLARIIWLVEVKKSNIDKFEVFRYPVKRFFSHTKCIFSYIFHPIDLKFLQNAPTILPKK